MSEIEQRSFSGAFTEQQFEELRESYYFTVTDWTGMGPMTEFDVYASVVAKPAAGTATEADDSATVGKSEGKDDV